MKSKFGEGYTMRKLAECYENQSKEEESLPERCKHCPNRHINDDWCIIVKSDCYKRAERDNKGC